MERGTLFDGIVKILDHRQPKYFILENVPFITKHDNEETWNYMATKFEEFGYRVDHHNYSPHDFGIPQPRGRLIERSLYQQAVDANNQRVLNNMDKYRLRQTINEHVFGTVKRAWWF